MVEQAQPDEAVLGDLRSNINSSTARATSKPHTAGGDQTVATLADRLITAHSATTGVADHRPGRRGARGPGAALRRTPFQARPQAQPFDW